MNNEITLIVLGVYTLIYVIVFIIQKTQIDKVKDINSSMKAFMDIFNIDEVKKYVELKEESHILKASNIIANDNKMQEIAKEFVKENADYVRDLQMEKMGNQYIEMSKVISLFLYSLSEDEGKRLVNEQLFSCKEVFLPIIDEIHKNKKSK